MAPIKINPGVQLGPVGRLLVEIIQLWPDSRLITITSGMDGDHGDSSHHYGLIYNGSPTAAIDYVHVSGGGVTPEDQKVMREVSAWLYNEAWYDTVELIHNPMEWVGDRGFYVKNQQIVPPYDAVEHQDHGHFAASEYLARKILSRLTKVTVMPSTIYGTDVSYHQKWINWPLVKEDGIQFAVMKASSGTSQQSPDSLPYFKANAPLMKKSIPLVGAYHWLKPGNYVDQVANFINSVKSGLGTYEGHIIQLDVEDGLVTPTDIKKWMEEWNRRTNAYPVIGYLPDWVENKWPGSDLKSYGFRAWWSSEYVAGTGPYKTLATLVTPNHWHTQDGVTPTILQYTSKAAIKGITGYCDANVTPLILPQLRALLTDNRPLTSPPSPPIPEEDDMPKFTDPMNLTYVDPATGDQKTITIKYETFLSLQYQQTQSVIKLLQEGKALNVEENVLLNKIIEGQGQGQI